MKYNTHNTSSKIRTATTSLQGTIECPYETLVLVFGKPMQGDEEDTDAEWDIEFEDGSIANIYNWRTGIAFMGIEKGLSIENITHWHVSGNNHIVMELVRECLEISQ